MRSRQHLQFPRDNLVGDKTVDQLSALQSGQHNPSAPVDQLQGLQNWLG
jgi:hypothetical protein